MQRENTDLSNSLIFIEIFCYISADDGSDQALQRMLGLSNDFDCFSAEDFREGLGKLDDNMIR